MLPDENAKLKTLRNLPTPIYFDRKKAAETIIQNLTSNFFVSVIGETGSGKSQLVNKTVTEILQPGTTESPLESSVEGRAGKRWRVVHLMPFADPLGNLAEALAAPDRLFKKGAKFASFRNEVETRLRVDTSSNEAAEGVGQLEASSRQDLEQSLRDANNALTQLYQEAVNSWGSPFNLLLVVDQMQELYRYQSFLKKNGKAGDDVHFVNLLLNAQRSGIPIYIIVVTDSRYLEFFSKYPGLPEAMNKFRVPIPNLSTKEIREYLLAQLPSPALAGVETRDPDMVEMATANREAELAFVTRLTSDYSELVDMADLSKRDAFALQKLNLSLSIVLKKWREASEKEEKNVPPLEIYSKEIGHVRNAISCFIAQNITAKQRSNAPQWKNIELIFKALTEKGGANQILRRPVELQELDKLLKRGQVAASTDFQAIISLLEPFNGGGEQFIRLPELLKMAPNTIIDIDSDSLLYNWAELSDWIETENTHASVYRNLVRDALNYFAPRKQAETPLSAAISIPDVAETKPNLADNFLGAFERHPLYGNAIANLIRDFLSNFSSKSDIVSKEDAPTNANQPMLLSGASLFSALQWKKECQPHEDWAVRYVPLEVDLPKDRLDLLQNFFSKTNIRNFNVFSLVEAFLEKSDRQHRNELKFEQGERLKANKQRNQALFTVLLAAIGIACSLYFMLDARQAKRNIELINFVEVLGANGILNLDEDSVFSDITVVIDSVVEDKTIRTNLHVLNFLKDKKILNIKATDTKKDWSYRGLLNLYDHAQEVNTGGEHEASLNDLKKICQEIRKDTTRDSQWQHPCVYTALWAHASTLETAAKVNKPSEMKKSLVEELALATIPSPQNNEYAYGDKNGLVFIRKKDQFIKLSTLIDDVIRGLYYSQNQQSLLIGTRRGYVYQVDPIEVPEGSHLDNAQKKRLYYDKDNSVYFIGQTKENGPILVGSTLELYFIEPKDSSVVQNESDFYQKNEGSTRQIDLDRVGYRDWSPDHQWFFITGKDKTLIYHLDPTAKDPSKLIELRSTISHPNITMLNLATKMNNTGNIWLALGGETGRVWLGTLNTAQFNQETIELDKNFLLCPPSKKHAANITGLKFNPDPSINQLASASADGAIRLWNLDNFSKNVSYDDIILHNKQGINCIQYINKDELVAHAGLVNWEIKTNLEALETYIDQLLCKLKPCN